MNPKQRERKKQEIFECATLIGWARCRWSHNWRSTFMYPTTARSIYSNRTSARGRFYLWFYLVRHRHLTSAFGTVTAFVNSIYTYFIRMVCATRCSFHSIPFFCSVGFLDLVMPPPPPSLPPPPMQQQSLYWMANEIQSNNIIIQASSCTTRCAVQQEKTY